MAKNGLIAEVTFKGVKHSRKKISQMLGWVQDVPLQIDTLQFLKFKQRYVNMEDQ